MFVHGCASAAPSKVTEPIITASSGTVPARGSKCGEPRQRLAHAQLAAARSTDRDAREQVEVDRECLAAVASSARPRRAPSRRRSAPSRRATAIARFSGRSPFDATSSITAKAKMPSGGGPAAEPLRVGERRRQIAAGRRLRDPGHGAADRAPRVERAEDVAEQHAQPGRARARRSRRRTSARSWPSRSGRPRSPRRRSAPAGRRRSRRRASSSGRLVSTRRASAAAAASRRPRASAPARGRRARRTRRRGPSLPPSRRATRGSADRSGRQAVRDLEVTERVRRGSPPGVRRAARAPRPRRCGSRARTRPRGSP